MRACGGRSINKHGLLWLWFHISAYASKTTHKRKNPVLANKSSEQRVDIMRKDGSVSSKKFSLPEKSPIFCSGEPPALLNTRAMLGMVGHDIPSHLVFKQERFRLVSPGKVGFPRPDALQYQHWITFDCYIFVEGDGYCEDISQPVQGVVGRARGEGYRQRPWCRTIQHNARCVSKTIACGTNR